MHAAKKELVLPRGDPMADPEGKENYLSNEQGRGIENLQYKRKERDKKKNSEHFELHS